MSDTKRSRDGQELSTQAAGMSRKLIAVFTLGILFLGVASIIKPDPRGATAKPITKPISSSAAQPAPQRSTHDVVREELGRLRHPQGWNLLGLLEDRAYFVLAYGSPSGPRYSVFSTDGRLLEADLPADDVYRSFPTLDLKSLRLDPPEGSPSSGPLMLANPQD